MRELVSQYLSKSISRRRFVNRLVSTGVTLTTAQSVAHSLTPIVHGKTGDADVSPEAVKIFQGTGGEAFAEQLIASGVKYIFGNSSSSDAPFYDALVDRPQLQYILTPHEGPGAAMAAGYVKASGKAAFVMEAAIVGLANAIGQMYNAQKEQTPLVFYSYRNDKSNTAGRDVFEEVPYQEEIVAPLTKWHWLARRPDMIPETIRRAFKVAWTPPYGPTYVTWHADYMAEKVRTEVIVHDKVDPRMRIRPNPREVERAARMLVEAENPLLIVGDEIYKTRSVDKAVRLAELLGMPVSQARQVFANYPHTHPLWVGEFPATRGVDTLDFPKNSDVVINVGNKLVHTTPAPIVPRDVKFIDMRNDSFSIGNVMTTDAPLVADVGYGMDDLIEAVESALTPSVRQKVTERAEKVRVFTEKAKKLRALVRNNPDWDNSPMTSDRVTYEVSQYAEKDAIIVHEAGAIGLHGFDFNPLGGRELFFYYGAHLGSGVGTAAGVKLARPDQQVIALVGDGAFIFGPTALWNMARLELPVTVVVYNNHAYGGVHNRGLAAAAGGRMVQTGHFVQDYLGKPDMNMASIADGFGVSGEVVHSPDDLKEALKRARRATREGRPYLIDAQVARTGVWADDPWIPDIEKG
ncbi:MAG: thiamine pyrophosphate-binding protein [Acidobacteriota bacterium]|nr:thiamine pyrophosphate-binding protein [Acidobacteriota bacterium]